MSWYINPIYFSNVHFSSNETEKLQAPVYQYKALFPPILQPDLSHFTYHVPPNLNWGGGRNQTKL